MLNSISLKVVADAISLTFQSLLPLALSSNNASPKFYVIYKIIFCLSILKKIHVSHLSVLYKSHVIIPSVSFYGLQQNYCDLIFFH